MVDKTTRDFHNLDNIVSGDIYIGCAESDNITYLARTIKAVQKQYSAIRYHLYSSNKEGVTDRLDQGLLDFAIISEEPDSSQYHCLTIPSNDRWGILMRADDSLAVKTALKLKDLLNLPLICSRQSMKEKLPQ